jgi:hypothetical protein
MQLEFSNIIKSNQDYGLLLTKSEWQLIKYQLRKDQLARIEKGEVVEYRDSKIRKVKK